MAGTPVKRAKREAQANQNAQEGEIPDADASEPTPPPPRRVRLDPRARPDLRAVPPPLPTQTGAEARRSVDYQHASELERLAFVMRPGMAVRVERIKPTWCAGCVEPRMVVKSGAMEDLIEHLREEWGGQTYLVTVLQPNGSPAFESNLTVCAPPRYEGRLIYRETWNGEGPPPEPERKRRGNPDDEPPRHAQASTFSDMRVMFELLKDVMQASSDKSLQAVQDIIANSRAEKEQLIEAVTSLRSQEVRGGNLVEQLGEFMTAQKALERVGKAFGAAANPAVEDEDVMKGALKHAAKDFLGNALSSHFMKRPTAPAPNARMPAPAHARTRARENPQKPPQMPAIPDAEVSGQNRPE